MMSSNRSSLGAALHSCRKLSDAGWLVLIVVVAALLRLHRLTEVSYWFDESFTLKMTEFPFPEMMRRIIEDDDNPPLFYLVLKLWIGLFGDSLAVPRLLSVFCGLMAVVGMFLFVREAHRLTQTEQRSDSASFAAILAAALIALSPAHIVWSNQVRMYSMTTATAAVSSYLLVRALRPDSGRREWALFTISSVLQVFTHYFGLFIALAQYLFALGYAWTRRSQRMQPALRPSVAAVLTSGVCFYVFFLPWLIPFLEHRERVATKFPAPLLSWSTAGAMLCRAFDLQLVFSVTPENGLFVAQGCFLIFLLLLIRRRPVDCCLVVMSILPFLAAALISLFMRNIFVQRYLLSAQMFVLASVAVAVSDIPWKLIRLGVALCLTAAMAWLSAEQYAAREFDAKLPGIRGAVAFLDAQRQPDEVVIVCNPMLFTSIVAYTHDRRGIYTHGSPGSYPFYQGTAVMRADEYISPEELRRSTGQRVWTFDADQWFGRTWSVPMPRGWIEISRSRFKEFNAELVVRCYARDVPL